MAVVVAPVGSADMAAFVTAVAASRRLHHPWVDPPNTPARFEAWLDRLAAPDQAAFLLRHTTCGGDLVGWVSVGNIVRGALQGGYVGYGALAGHEGRGLMAQGLRVVLGLCFGELALHRVEANIQPDNVASLALARRLGFVKEGFSPRYLLVDGDWRDHERWALRVDQWTAADPVE